MLLKHLEAAKSYNHWKGQMSPFRVGGKKWSLENLVPGMGLIAEGLNEADVTVQFVFPNVHFEVITRYWIFHLTIHWICYYMPSTRKRMQSHGCFLRAWPSLNDRQVCRTVRWVLRIYSCSLSNMTRDSQFSFIWEWATQPVLVEGVYRSLKVLCNNRPYW